METEPATADTVDVAVVEIDGAAVVATSTPLDLDGIQRDLADVEIALTRLDAGTYWTDEVTGNELPPELLAAQPTARRAAAATV
jgi:RNA polymerase-binding transcription factor DksA